MDARTDIYAIGRILELLAISDVYNKVIARCTAADPSDRYQSVEAIQTKKIKNPAYDVRRLQSYKSIMGDLGDAGQFVMA